MLQLFYEVVEDQKHHYSYPIYRKFDYVHFNHSYCAPGSTRDVCFGTRVSATITVPDPSFSILDLGSQVPCKISVSNFRSKVPLLGSQVSTSRPHLRVGSVPGLGSWVPPLGSPVSGPRSHSQDGSRVSSLGSYHKSRVSGPNFRICRF